MPRQRSGAQETRNIIKITVKENIEERLRLRGRLAPSRAWLTVKKKSELMDSQRDELRDGVACYIKVVFIRNTNFGGGEIWEPLHRVEEAYVPC